MSRPTRLRLLPRGANGLLFAALGALALLATACGRSPAAPAGWSAIARASGAARAEAIAAYAQRHEGALGKALDDERRGAHEFAATEAASKAAADVIDAYRPGRPDPSLALVADRSNRWPRSVRAAALRALARLHEPSAARLLGGRAWALDVAEEDAAAAWVALAEALAPAGDPETRRKMRGALETTAAARESEGAPETAAAPRALAARLAALDAPPPPLSPEDLARLRTALASGTPDERAAAAHVLVRTGTPEAKAALSERATAEKDPFVRHQLERLLGAGAGPAPRSPRAGWERWTAERDGTDPADEKAATNLRLSAEAFLTSWEPGADANGVDPDFASLTPADRLALARFAEVGRQGAALRRWLESLSEERGEEGRIAATWRLTLALEDQDPAAAVALLKRIETDFEGKGLSSHGAPLPASVLAGATVEAAAGIARRAVEGPTPDPAAAAKALEAGAEALSRVPEDGEAAEALEAARAWTALDAAALAPLLGAGTGPRVLVVADHFQLLEPWLPSVLERWARGADVVLVGFLDGRVRRGMRREPAPVTEEKAAIAAAAKEIGVPVARFAGRGGEVAKPLWLGESPAAVFLLDAAGTLVARLSGPGLDPRTLDPAFATISRDPAATAPPR